MSEISARRPSCFSIICPICDYCYARDIAECPNCKDPILVTTEYWKREGDHVYRSIDLGPWELIENPPIYVMPHIGAK